MDAEHNPMDAVQVVSATRQCADEDRNHPDQQWRDGLHEISPRQSMLSGCQAGIESICISQKHR